MNNINIDTNNTNNQDRQDPSEGDVEHVAPEDQAIQRHSASSTHSAIGSSSSRPMSSADHIRALVRDQEDEAMVHPDEGLILRRLTQTEQIKSSLIGIAQKNGQILVSAIVANPHAGASSVAYHLTVPPRYLELGDLR